MFRVFLLSMCVLSTQLMGDLHHHVRPDSHAPIGVMGDHTHEAGEWMGAYRFMSMSMAGNRSDKTSLSVDDVLDDYMVAPLDMTMNMHMFGAMIAPTDKLTVMIMLPYIQKSMDHRKRDLSEFTRESSGIGDLSVGTLCRVFKTEDHAMHMNTALSIPVGSVEEKDGQAARLPYPMQLGSGTLDLKVGNTYTRYFDHWSLGSQLNSVLRFGESITGYTLGNRYSGTVWVSKLFTRSISASLRTTASLWEDISGADADLNPMMVPTASADKSGHQVDLSVGLNYVANTGKLKGHRVAVELGMPVLQSFDGVQLETEWVATVGWQYAP